MIKTSNSAFAKVSRTTSRSASVILTRAILYRLLFLIAMATGTSQAQEPDSPKLRGPNGEGQQAIDQFKYPAGLQCQLFAAEPEVANIVAFHRDYQGRLFVCETYRQERGVEDNRNHAHWMDEELAARTVQDRIDYVRKYVPDADKLYTTHDDRIRLLLDENGDGKADRTTVFSDHFNQLEMGTGAGVLSYRGKVYYTCIPDLFLLEDNDQDGIAEVRESLQTGYGVRYAFRGHDLHGLIVGPDGRLYFSIGDRGYNISPGINDPASGAVFRCELDGSNLEVVATGLRNPQELAFDEFGNLFTGDNNSDSGDKARWVYVVEGGDSGWRMYYQYIEDRGPFNRELIWHPFNDLTPAYIIPPVANFADGPSGLEYYPGTGFGDRFKGRFFLCDFRGVADISGIRSLRVEQDGAFWTLEDDEKPFWNLLATDIDFGSDGKLYASDWVFGWDGVNKGRVYTFFDPAQIDTAIVTEVEELLRNGLAEKTDTRLRDLLEHPDQRVRQETQFELVRRRSIETFKNTALTSGNRLARIHSIWGLSQLARYQRAGDEKNEGFNSGLTNLVMKLIGDDDAEIRAQAAQLAADINFSQPGEIAKLLSDGNLRVRFYAAMSLSKIGNPECLDQIIKMLAENADADPIIRHGGIMALTKLLSSPATVTAILPLVGHESKSVRLAVCVAIRKTLDAVVANQVDRQSLTDALAKLLNDSDQSVLTEATRTIHDLPVNDLMPALAVKLNETAENALLLNDAVVRRLLNANLRAGTKENAIALAKFAANNQNETARRIDAIQGLINWAQPPERDAVLNDWRPLDTSTRNLADAQQAFSQYFLELAGDHEEIAAAAISAAGDLALTGIEQDLQKVVLSESANDTIRIAALRSLRQLNFNGMSQIISRMSRQFSGLPPGLAATVAELAVERDPLSGLGLIERVLQRNGNESLQSKQQVIATLGRMQDAASAQRLLVDLKRVATANYPEALRLDVVMAAENRNEEELKLRLAEYRETKVSQKSSAGVYEDTLSGGNAANGKKIFFGKTEVSCVRCHRVDTVGGEVGPDLSGVAVKHDRKYLLDAIVDPNKIITEGYAQVKVLTIEGQIQVGLVTKETETELRLLNADGVSILIAKDDIEDVKSGLSAMPDDLIKQLTLFELRDLIEYLSTLKTTAQPAEKSGHKSP